MQKTKPTFYYSTFNDGHSTKVIGSFNKGKVIQWITSGVYYNIFYNKYLKEKKILADIDLHLHNFHKEEIVNGYNIKKINIEKGDK